MRKTSKIFICIILLAISLSACKSEITEVKNTDIKINEHQLFLFEPFQETLGVYDKEQMIWNKITTEHNAFFQSFNWGEKFPFYVIGQQGELPFSVLKANFDSLECVYTLDNKEEAMAPFATNGETFYYIIEQIENNNCYKKIISISDIGEEQLVAKLDGMPIMAGLIINDSLYFTCSVENSDNYEIWCLNLNSKTTEQTPEIVRNDYNYFRLYQYNGKLLNIDFENNTLFNDEIVINLTHRMDSIFIDEEVELLVEKYVTSTGDLEMTFSNVLTGEILGIYSDAINFNRKDSVITVFGNGYTKTIFLKENSNNGIN